MSADPSRHFLLVPMNVEALAVGAASAAIDLAADFSALAEGGPCLGSLLAREPFQETPQALAPGVYLHWSLPDGLTHAPESGEGEASLLAVAGAALAFTRAGGERHQNGGSSVVIAQ